MSTSSAIPEYLDLFAERSTEIDDSIARRAKGLGAALDALRSSGSVGLVSVPKFDADVVALVARGRSLSQRVEMIADGFLAADGRPPMHPDALPRIRRVDDAALYESVRLAEMAVQAKAMSADKEPFDLMDRLRPMGASEWFHAINGSAVLSTSDAYYSGGGSLLGPDGRRYPLVVPNLVIGGRVYNGDRDLPFHEQGVAALGGLDTGWVMVATRTGMVRKAEEPAMAEKFAIAAAGMNANIAARTSAKPEALGSLHISPTGWPWLATAPDVVRTPAPPPATVDDVMSPTHVVMDGNLVSIDRMRPEAQNRAIRRSGFASTNVPARSMGTAVAGVDIVSGMLSGYALAQGVDDFHKVAYQAVFEENIDGRLRSQLREYQVLQAPNELSTIVPRAAFFDGESLDTVPLSFRQWMPSITNGEQEFLVKEYTVRRSSGEGVDG